MLSFQINLLSVLLGSVASMAIGFLWYSPFMFGKHWMKAMGFDAKSMEKMKESMDMRKTYSLAFLSSLVTTYVLNVVTLNFDVLYVWEGVIASFILWLGFIAPVKFIDFLFSRKSTDLFLIDSFYQLSCLVIASVIFVLVSSGF
ncbi:hypothetical protein A2716_03015 [candidate division WWE3 bacterium RIFCSPHIGHO2_01_FULL_40_23]|uniref:DUF1761 domain-containing protein n=1 Tax=candidate division WWE3 bacterium RIFCSPLOWO2_01_FULL_41_18 TaxID=1802625 RepID=A0A1F4VC18_UNCKA|nr:MAG: hypothetical protein A2716_03015 [candidate division WWE3 bacterium RIFCSPHIGHO2_01_FULL_40_23]OGC54801.1 MAG: hypothetical protein A3A78_04970 [candidate division WWE3 bacterium RIFCSPLOWO2_01_FULL_41_18]